MPKPTSVNVVRLIRRTDILIRFEQDEDGNFFPIFDYQPVQFEQLAKSQTILGQTTTTPNEKGKYYIPTEYSAAYSTYSPGAVKSSRKIVTDFGTFYEQTWSPMFVGGNGSMDYTALRNKAALRLAEKLKQGAPNLAVGLAEHRQTASLLLTNAARIVTAIRSLRRFDLAGVHTALRIRPPSSNTIRNAARWSRTSANNRTQIASSYWLEIQYGWKPLLSDVYSSVDYLHGRRDRADILRYRVSSSDSTRSSTSVNGVNVSNTTNTARLTANLSLRATADDLAILEASSLGITNPLLVAWELVPYSFVVDWFIPIGNYLDAWGVLSLQSFSGSHSIKDTAITTNGGTYPEPSLGEGSFVEIERTTDKGVFFSRHLGAPILSLPTIKNPFSGLRVANALALLVQKAKLSRS